MDKRYEFLKKVTVLIIFFIVLFYGLIQAQKFLVPILLGVLFSYLLYPIVNLLEKHKFPRILANLVAIIIGGFIIFLTVKFLSDQFSVFAEGLPKIKEQASENLKNMRDSISDSLGISPERFEKWGEDFLKNFFESSGEFFQSFFSATTSTIVSIGLMPVFIFFMLYYRNKFHDFIIAMVPDNQEEKSRRVLKEVNLVAKKYMTGVFIVVIILSVLNSIGLSIIGLDYPILLGITAALFNFIPYFGTLIGAAFPLLYAILAMPSPDYALWVLIYFIIIQFVENNILTPNITGGIVRLNPFITILSLILGSMVWGVAGMFLIVPFMAMIRIMFENISFLKPVGFLLSNKGTEKHAITWSKIKRMFSKK
ncbi:MAG: AI-2E family transporter [Candidatus Cyclobacteriaceae bacterium M2_1C_046]